MFYKSNVRYTSSAIILRSHKLLQKRNWTRITYDDVIIDTQNITLSKSKVFHFGTRVTFYKNTLIVTWPGRLLPKFIEQGQCVMPYLCLLK